MTSQPTRPHWTQVRTDDDDVNLKEHLENLTPPEPPPPPPPPPSERWGIRIEKADSNPDTRVTYLYDAVGMTPASMNFSTGEFNYGSWKDFCDTYNRPVMLKSNGDVDYELDPDDQTLKKDGTASDIENTAYNGNAMSEFKRLWLRTYEDATYQYIIFSNVQYDENYHANAFTNSNGQVQDAMYHAMFDGSDVSSTLRSLATGSVMRDVSASGEITRAEANGTGWHITYKSQRDFINYLLTLISKSTNSQAVFGEGRTNTAHYLSPGSLKTEGRFWGDDATIQAVKVFYIENYWGNCWQRMSGMIYNSDAKILVKATPPYSLTGVDYTNTGITLTGTSGQYITAGTLLDAGFIPTTAGGSDSTFFADGLVYGTPDAGVFNVAIVGGTRNAGGLSGSWACSLNAAGVAEPNVGASLSFLKE